ncbi:MAG: YafY family protein [Candidatus Eremiobacteraeota bacterium]|nr:YafY family protein [Candidatus Eremiobacteraeota bacterium]
MPGTREQVFRQLQILRRIQVRSTLTAQDLARELEVSVRTIYRDIGLLNESGFPIYFDNGYRLPGDYYFPQINFEMDELVALFLSSRFLLRYRDLPYYRLIKSAMDKIEGSVNAQYREMLTRLDHQFAVGIPYEMFEGTSSKTTDTVNKAILDHRCLEILYHTFMDDTVKTRKVEPYGIFFSQDNWYILAFCHLRREIREFNLKRIKKATILEEKFSLPEGFTISRHLCHPWDFGEDDPVKVVIRHSPPAARKAREAQWHPSQELKEQDDGSVIMTVKVRAPENMIAMILSQRGEVEVVSPISLRHEVASEIRKMALLYDGKPRGSP